LFSEQRQSLNQLTHSQTFRKGIIWLVISTFAYGSLTVLIKWSISSGLNGETALALRFTMAALIWCAILVMRRQSIWPGARLAGRAAAIGALVYATNALAFYRGTGRVTGTLAAVTVAAVPVFVALLAWLMLGEKLTWRGWVALVMVVVGGVMLAGGLQGSADLVGMLWLIGAIFLYSLYVVLSTPLTRALSPSISAFYIISGAAVAYWLWGALSGSIDFGFAPSGWLAVASMALISTVLALSTFLAGSRIVGATRAAIVTGMEPLVGAGLSVILLGDRPSLLQIAGGALLIAAAVLVQRERQASKESV
ncbi:MAG: DMT family transporter, partial [Anaerolineae bacterium]|nr:DMT family transporter [Anaerolineae bacterium]